MLPFFMSIVVFLAVVGVVYAHQERPIAADQTEGFGRDQLLVFTYDDPAVQPFECSVTGDPNTCVVGVAPGTTSKGKAADEVPDLGVIVPIFDADFDGNSEVASLPVDAFEDRDRTYGVGATDPGLAIDLQCPEPGSPFGTCFNHPDTLDVSLLFGNPIGTNVVPLPNHSHIVRDTPGGSVAWDTTVNFVCDPSVWPNADGTTGITSFEALAVAQATDFAGPFAASCGGKQASGNIPTEMFLFFGVNNLR